MAAFRALLVRDIMLALRGNGIGLAISFVLAFLVMIPLAIGPDLATMSRLAPGLMWLSLLLAVLLTAERIFQPDFDDGSLDLLILSQSPLELVVLAKVLAHWLSTSLPLAIIAAPLGLLLNLNTAQILPLMLAMILGSLMLSAVAAIAGAVTAGLRRGGLLVPLLSLPLYVPVLVFGLSASNGAAGPSGAGAALLVLAGLGLLLLVMTPWAAAAALRAYLR